MESDPKPPDTPATEDIIPTPAPDETTDPAALVDRLIAAGEWPEPELIERIAAMGEAALDPLLAFIRTYPDPKDYRREIVLFHAIGILSLIHSSSTITDLIEVIRRYPEDSGELAAEVLGEFGGVAFEPALELLRKIGPTGAYHAPAIAAAKRTAGADPALRAQVAEVLRPMLADALERAREAARRSTAEGKADADREDEPQERLMFLICDLADLADPKARDLINAAFKERLVPTFWVDRESIEESYRRGGETPPSGCDWFEDYRSQYRSHHGIEEPREEDEEESPRSSGAREVHPLSRPVQEPVRNTGPKIGRNDPCWCGSGKKYKKCHLGKD